MYALVTARVGSAIQCGRTRLAVQAIWSYGVVAVLGEIVHQALPVQLIGFEHFHMFEVPTHEVAPQADVGSYVYGHTTTLAAEHEGYLTLSLLILVAVGALELLGVVCLR